MGFLNSRLTRALLIVAVAIALASPAVVYAGGKDSRGGHDSGGAAGAAAESVGGANANVDLNVTDGQGDERVGDVSSNQTGAGPHTGAKGRGAGGEDVVRAGTVAGAHVLTGAKTSTGTTATHTTGTHTTGTHTTGTHTPGIGTTGTGGTSSGGTMTTASNTTETTTAGGPSTTAGETTAAGAVSEIPPIPSGTAAVTAPSAAALPAAAPGQPATTAAPPTPPLGAQQTTPGAPAPQQMAAGTAQVKPRTLPFNGLAPAWAAFITGGRWAGSLLGMLGLLLLVRGFRKFV